MEEEKLTRSLSARHIQMIALGGTIGVGLFMGASSTIRWTGPSVMELMRLQDSFVFDYACFRRNALRRSFDWFFCKLRERVHPSCGWLLDRLE